MMQTQQLDELDQGTAIDSALRVFLLENVYFSIKMHFISGNLYKHQVVIISHVSTFAFKLILTWTTSARKVNKERSYHTWSCRDAANIKLDIVERSQQLILKQVMTCVITSLTAVLFSENVQSAKCESLGEGDAVRAPVYHC